ncbi:tripartite tricarboxylate transporter substrate binding protein [Paracoccus sp. 1_MG-2023]|uniref:tripartite tricarboxylate transporter substrate binding protein n=1 Tax=unclassified Paracoccus (in: a-proteobacteria) TaxID=2688777 RepID=UPI001C09E049|nr:MULTISPECIES: tripartite tricarboxylate transporter substrate binding protein [unclassified Paracoccus (in: a-proteobacteria)]MBU2957737.1 tripartite tricarboxylate transporter substrate binding protein [Paracoccus sp. C2R09]MDO6667415.1 tripartite tricarboxylate transporter substrate binding protein [Paracoccus sp. 1_MG-2023]
MTDFANSSRRGLLKGAAALAGAGLLPGFAWAADYPSRPLTMIVPWGAGGGTDATARMISALLERKLGQPVNVVNRTGGAGVVGHSAIATAPADGYTLGVVTVEIAMMHHMGLTQLTSEDYTPLGLMNADSPAVTVSANAGYADIGALIEAIKASEPGTFKASGTGQGGIWHLALVGWLKSLGLEANHVTWVPSEGSAPAMQDLIAGGVDIITVSLAETKAMVDAGRAVNLALMSTERAASHPDLPTLAEGGASDFALATWRGIGGPRDLPQDVAQMISTAVAEIAVDPEFTEFMDSRGFNVAYLDPEAHAQMMKDADAQMADAMTAAGLIRS